ncbi:MAG: NADH-quinone oxidoreductase subunit K, partial [Luteimonas sp.]|nr:NADH-quinone oxidoreductase subunit K [Luteimonas sp.]
MELMLAITISITVAAGILLVLSGELFRLVIGLAMLGSAVNLVVFMTARPGSIVPPVIEPGLAMLPADAVNALPQAL